MLSVLRKLVEIGRVPKKRDYQGKSSINLL